MAHEYGFHVGRRGFFGTIPLPSRCHRCNSAKIHRCWSLGNIGIKGALFSNGYGSIPMKIPFLGGWTSIYQLFWCELQGDRVLTHPQISFCAPRYLEIFGDSSQWLMGRACEYTKLCSKKIAKAHCGHLKNIPNLQLSPLRNNDVASFAAFLWLVHRCSSYFPWSRQFSGRSPPVMFVGL